MGIDASLDITTRQRKEITDLLSRYLPGVEVWAFGSRVKWSARPESDLDLVAFAKPEQDARVSDLREAFAESSFPLSVELHVWRELPESFQKNIKAEYVVLQKAEPTRKASAMASEWRPITLGNVLSFANGKTSPVRSAGPGNPVYGSNGVIGFASETNALENTIVIGRVGSYCGSLYLSKEKCWVTDNAIRASALDDNDARFLFYLLTTLDLNHWRAGSGQPLLNQTILSQIPASVPLPDQQRAIACILGALDDKIELNRRMNRTLEAMARATFKSWFVDFDPVRAKADLRRAHPKWTDQKVSRAACPNLKPALAALFPDSFEDSELGEIPKGWEALPLHDTATFINGAAFKSEDFCAPGEGLPVVKIAELKDGITSQTKWCQRQPGPDQLIDTGDLLYSWSGSPDTSLDAFLWTRGPGLLNQHIFKVVTPAIVQKRFVYYLLKHLRPVLVETARNKQTTGLGHVTVADMKRLKVCWPRKAVLDAFDSLTGTVFDKAFAGALECQTLAALRDALLPKLISGELRVKDTARFVDEVDKMNSGGGVDYGRS